MKRPLAIGLVAAGLLVVVSFVVFQISHKNTATRSNDSQLAVSQDAAKTLPSRSPNIPNLRLASGLVPPTNKWFSSLAFSTAAQPVFAYPLSFKLSDTGYGIGAPPVVDSPNAIFGSHLNDIMLSMDTPQHIVSAYDDLSVTVANQNAAGETVAESRITQGSPYVFTMFKKPQAVKISLNGGIITKMNNQAYRVVIGDRSGDRSYGIYSDAPLSADQSSLTVNAVAGSLVSVFALPSDSNQSAAYFANASHPITTTHVTYTTDAKNITTTYKLETKSGETLFAQTPTMSIAGGQTTGSFTTLLGDQVVHVGNSFIDKQATPTLAPAALPLNKLTDAQRQDVIAKLNSDAADLTFTQTDTYFGGKELYRAANLLQTAETLGQTKTADSIKTKLAARLGEWLDPTGSTKRSNLYFYYDPSYRGVVGELASYGSDGFNDHHFHYGYFIYAAAILSTYDQDFYKAHASMVNVLISDIASSGQSSLFPKLRVFDAYAGHSWASGNGDFGDGNNQESSSEAANAWYGMYLWAQVSHNDALKSESIWLYAHETTTANHSWLSVPQSKATSPEYTHPTIGIVWGGKLDYSTFFSARPQSILGIQLIPMSPGQNYLAQTNVKQNIASVAPSASDLAGQFNDYLVMYQALSDPQLALQQAAQLNAQDLDNGNSMTYFYSWLYSHQT